MPGLCCAHVGCGWFGRRACGVPPCEPGLLRGGTRLDGLKPPTTEWVAADAAAKHDQTAHNAAFDAAGGRRAYESLPPSSFAAAALSKLPPVRFVSSPITRPISFFVVAPVSASTVSMSADSCSPDSCWGSSSSSI